MLGIELQKVHKVEVRITERSYLSECIFYVPDYSNMGKKSRKNEQTKIVIVKCSKETEISKLTLPYFALSDIWGVNSARQCFSHSSFFYLSLFLFLSFFLFSFFLSFLLL